MAATAVHETELAPKIVESAQLEQEPSAVLALLPQYRHVGIVAPQIVPDEISQPEIEPSKSISDPISAVEAISSEPHPVPEKIPFSQTLSLKPPSELALDLVLNEIVLQARLTTNATGAVLGLAHSGELVCRATTGATAADVSVCLKAKSGIAATCFETAEVRRVDDLGSDTNADAVAYRRSGVRSVLVVPVQGESGLLLGILEIFSPRVNAFCDRDVLTLQAMARRIAANIELIRRHYGSVAGVANPEPRNVAALDRDSRTETRQRVTRSSRKSGAAQVWSRTSALRSRLSSVDWISILAKSGIALVLLAGCISARSCWQRSGDAKLIQLIIGPMSHASAPAVPQVEKNVASNTTVVNMQHLSLDPSTWPARAPEHQEMRASITIQRVPVHIAKAAAVVANKPAAMPTAHSEAAAIDHHKTVSQGPVAQQSKLAANDPAASVLPNKTAEGNAGPVVLPTQAAMARLVQRIEPEYPNAARQQHIQGTVVLDVLVDTSGAVEGIGLVSGESQLMLAATVAVKQWHFQPLIQAGKPEKFESRIAIDFSLASEGGTPGH